MKVKTEKNISYPEARRLCEPKNAAGPVSYAQAAATSLASKATGTTNTIATQTDITVPKDTDNPTAIKMINNQTQTETEKLPSKEQTQRPTVRLSTKPGPKFTKPTHPQKQTKKSVQSEKPKKTDQKEKQKNKTKTVKPQKGLVEIEISNRYSSLGSDDEEEEDMETTAPPGFSSDFTRQAASNPNPH